MSDRMIMHQTSEPDPNAPQGSTSRQTPNLLVIPEGGAMCSRVDESGEYTPDLNVLIGMMQRVPERLRNLFGRIELVENNDLLMSDDVKMCRMEQFGKQLQQELQRSSSRIIAVAGSHKIARYAAATAMAASPSSLGHSRGIVGEDVPQNGRSIILTSSRHAPSENGSDAVEALQDAIELSADPRMQGRAGVLFHRKLYALYGLQRPQNPTELMSRFMPIAYKDDRSHWYFTDLEQYHVPYGDEQEEFRLDTRVQTFVLEGDEEKDDSLVSLMYQRKSNDTLRGTIVKTVAGKHPMTSLPNDRIDEINGVKLPSILVGRRNGNGNSNGEHAPESHDTDFEYLLDACQLFSGEAKLLMARALADAERDGVLDRTELVIDYVRARLHQHPFAIRTN